jgi:hypothetical protein
MELEEITPEPKTDKKPIRDDKIRAAKCFFCKYSIGNREFEYYCGELICGECYYETGDNGG